MGESDTPPTGSKGLPPPPRALPTVATVAAGVEALLREMRGLRIDVEAVKTDTKALRSQLTETEEIIRISRLPSPASLSPVPSTPPPTAPRPSMAAKAATGSGKAGKWILLGSGVLTVVAQAIAMFNKPEYGPIVAALRVLLSSLTGAPNEP